MSESAPSGAEAAPAASLELCLRLSLANAVLTRRLDNALSSLHGLSFGDLNVLLQLSRASGLKLRRIDLAERLGLTASGVTRTLLPLEKLGLVARESDPRDARVARATLTPAGQRLLGHAMVTAEQVSGPWTRVASKAQIDALASLLERLSGVPSPVGDNRRAK